MNISIDILVIGFLLGTTIAGFLTGLANQGKGISRIDAQTTAGLASPDLIFTYAYNKSRSAVRFMNLGLISMIMLICVLMERWT